MMHIKVRHRLLAMIGNVLEHYDVALFGLLAPFLAPLFFDDKDPLTALILTYCILPLGVLARPVGSLFFGWIGDRLGRTRALFFSLSGMAFATIGMGCLPTYAEIGGYAPILLALGRTVQNFCAAGEIIGGAIFVLEHTDLKKRNLMSSLYDVSTVVGIMLASFFVTLLSFWGNIEESWRLLFWGGGITASLGMFLRWRAREGREFLQSEKKIRLPLVSVIKEHGGALLAVICVSGFSYTTYSFAFTLMNGYVPLVTSVSKTEVMAANTILLVIDMFLLPLFGYVAARFGRERLMSVAAIGAVFSALPVFYLLNGANLAVVIAMRMIIVIMGVAFSASYHAWAQERVEPAVRYTVLSLGYALGTQLIGSPTAAASLWMYQKTGWTGAPAIYLMAAAALAAFMVKRYSVALQRKSTPV